MKLQELAQTKPTQQIARVFESYFESKVTFERLTSAQTQNMLRRVRSLIKEHRGSTNRHYGERNPAYLKLIMMEQALSSHLQEMTPPTQPVNGAKPINGAQPVNGAQSTTTAMDPKLKAAKDKLSKGQTLSSDEQKMINAAAIQEQTGRLSRAYKTLKESEVQQAQVVLAAQDMVDSMQGMIEDATEMQYKELPALVDSIRNQIGLDQANQFNTDATAALTGLVQSLQGAKTSLETALGVVTGQAQPAPALDAAMNAPAGELPPPTDNPEAMPADDLSTPDVGDEEEPAAGTPGGLGRERR